MRGGKPIAETYFVRIGYLLAMLVREYQERKREERRGVEILMSFRKVPKWSENGLGTGLALATERSNGSNAAKACR